MRVVIITALFMGALVLPSSAQDGGVDPDRYVELVRTALQTQKMALVTENMALSEEQAAKFWPIYREYEAERTKLGDKRVAVIRDYSAHFKTMNDETAESLANRALSVHEERLALRRTYFKKFANALGAAAAARFVQIDHQIDLVLDLEIASRLPLVTRSAGQE